MKLKKTWMALLLFPACTALGYVAGAYKGEDIPGEKRAHVTGIGGIFFRSANPKVLKKWYDEHLGLHAGDYGTFFEWREGSDSSRKGYTVWAPFHEKTTYFPKALMINYRVNDLALLLEQLKTEGIEAVDTIEHTSYGDFAHIMDPEGNKIELWEPKDEEYEKLITTPPVK